MIINVVVYNCFLHLLQKPGIPMSKLKIVWDKRLGGGTFGEVYKASWQYSNTESKEVAIKLIKEGISHENATEVRNEIQFLRYNSKLLK